jgi:hypothetical protein
MVDNLIKKEKVLRILLFGFILLFLFAIVYFVSFQMSGNVIFHSFDYVEEVPIVNSVNIYSSGSLVNCDFDLNYSDHSIEISDDYFNRISFGNNDIYSANVNLNFYCDEVYCYAVDSNKYFLKVNHQTGEQIFNYTEGYIDTSFNISDRMSTPINLFHINDLIIGIEDFGHLMKKNKISGDFYYDSNPLISNSAIYKVFCDETYCYALDYLGNFLKINHQTNEHIFNQTDSAILTNSTIDQFNDIYCDETYCYGINGYGYLFKINHQTGEHIYNTTEGFTNKLFNSGTNHGTGTRSVICDETYCYGVERVDYNYGYFLKVNHQTGEQIFNYTEGFIKTFNITSFDLHDFYCDETYCFMSINGRLPSSPDYYTRNHILKINHITGDFTVSNSLSDTNSYLSNLQCDDVYCYANDKANSNGNRFIKYNYQIDEIVFGGEDNYLISSGNNIMFNLQCDDIYCYGLTKYNYLVKFKKDIGPLSAVVNFYENNLLIDSEKMSHLENNTIYRSSIDYNVDNLSLGNTYSCNVTSFSNPINLSESLISQNLILEHVYPAMISNLNINQSNYIIYLNLSYYYRDNYEGSGNVYIDWYLNDEVVESDIIYNTYSNEFLISYFNSSKDEGDEINVKVFVEDDFFNSSNFSYSGSSSSISFEGNFNLDDFDNSYPHPENIYCDNEFCYDSYWVGPPTLYLLKTNYETNEKIFDSSESFAYFDDSQLANTNNALKYISCDDTYCYGIDQNPNFYKINKITGESIISYEDDISFWNYPTSFNVFLCDIDDTYCYFESYGDVYRVDKITGEITDYSFSGMGPLSSFYFDDNYFYGSNDYGHFLKMEIRSGEYIYHDWATGPMEDVIELSDGEYSLFCDDTYCYGADNYGCFLKINHNTGEIIFGLDESGYCDKYFSKIALTSGGESFPIENLRLYCDDTYCYAVDYDGNFLQIDHTSGDLILDMGDFIVSPLNDTEHFSMEGFFYNDNAFFSIYYYEFYEPEYSEGYGVSKVSKKNNFVVSTFTLPDESFEESLDGSFVRDSNSQQVNKFIEEDLIEEKQLNLAYKSEISLKIKNNNHKLVIDEIEDDSAVISIFSEKQTKKLIVGEEWKVNLDGDNYYDLSVKLNSVLRGVVNISIKSIQEQINEDKIDITLEEETPYINSNEMLEFNFFDVILIILFLILLILFLYKIINKKE